MFIPFIFFFNDTATTEIYTLSLHDALPISHFVQHYNAKRERCWIAEQDGAVVGSVFLVERSKTVAQLRLLLVERSEEHTSELQSHSDLVCRLLLEKKKK